MKWTAKLENLFRRKLDAHSTINDIEQNKKPSSNPTAMPINFNLRMLIITDTHGCLSAETISQDHNADVCLLLGDLSTEDIMIVKEKVRSIPIYGVLGNHDGFELYDRCGIENIHGKVVTVNGVRIAGMQGSLRYKYSDMPLYTDEESVEIADNMESADILISHDSPKYLHSTEDFAHSGLEGIGYYCSKHNVPINIHGHHHENTISVLDNGTTSICCYGVQILDTKNF